MGLFRKIKVTYVYQTKIDKHFETLILDTSSAPSFEIINEDNLTVCFSGYSFFGLKQIPHIEVYEEYENRLVVVVDGYISNLMFPKIHVSVPRRFFDKIAIFHG